MKMQRLMSMQPVKLIALLLLINCSIVLASCSQLKPFPAKEIYEVDIKSKSCRVWALTIKEGKIQATLSQKLSIESCHGVFGFATKDIPNVLDWAEHAYEYVERECK